jgi:hypothetical protein
MRYREKTLCFVPRSDSEASGGGSEEATAADETNSCVHVADASMDRLRKLLAARENEQLEFKEARNNFHFDKLVKYCAAMANEGGGSIVLGVGDKRPRRIVGSHAFADIERTKADC